MEKVVLIPDSFKGNMSSLEVCNIMENAIRKHFKNAEILKIPVADGGEGCCDCFIAALGGEKVCIDVTGPDFKKIKSFYARTEGETAVIEMSAAAGLPLASNKNPATTTTYGVGELILDAMHYGAKKIILGLGGSATNDGGAGCLAALGAKFYDVHGKTFVPVGGTLSDICVIDISELEKNIEGVEFLTMCDVDNPLLGYHGAARVYAPQKGADERTVALLERGLADFAAKTAKVVGFMDDSFPGAGAAGGMGYGVRAYLHSKIKSGIDTVLEIVKFDDIAKDADLVLTGEGKFDKQSLMGKAVLGIAFHAKKLDVPLIVVAGDIGDGVEEAYDVGISAVYSINRVAKPFVEVRNRAKDDLYLTVDTICRMLKIC